MVAAEQWRTVILNPNPANPSPPGGRPPAARRRLRPLAWLVLPLALIAAAALALSAWWRDAPSPPVVTLDGPDTAVRAALDQARNAVLAAPGSDEAWGHYGMTLYAHDFAPTAADCFEQAAQLDRDDYRWPYLTGIAAAFTDPERGRAAFQRATRLRPDLPFVRLRAAELLIDLGRHEHAREHVDAALALEPNNPRAALAAAQLAFQRGDLSEARAWAARCVEQTPDAAAYELLARICFQHGDEPAARQYQQLLQQSRGAAPERPDPLLAEIAKLRRDKHWELVQIQQQLDTGRTAEAIAALRQALADSPDSVEFRIELVQALASIGRHSEAAQALDQGIERSANSPRLHRMRGALYYQRAEHETAAAAFRRAVALKPDYALAHYNLGTALLASGDETAALDAFRTALAIQPDLPGLQEDLVSLEARLR